MSSETGGGENTDAERIFAEFNKSWMKFWDAYVELQNQLYESIRAAREVSWLAATDTQKISEINQAQRELFATMPRRIDYMPLGQISRDLDSAVSKLEALQSALSRGKEMCTKLEDATVILKESARITEEALAKVKR